MNEPFTAKLKWDIPDYVPTTFGNLLIQLIHRSIQVGPRILSPLYKSLASIISNISPYVKDLTKESSECILQLVKKFANVSFLKESENNCRVLSNIFEAINYILQYHDEGNEEFLVTLIKYRELFSFIETLKLSDDEPEMKKLDSAEVLDEEAKENQHTNIQHHEKKFGSRDWETHWKESLNLINITQAIKYTDEKARNFLQ